MKVTIYGILGLLFLFLLWRTDCCLYPICVCLKAICSRICCFCKCCECCNPKKMAKKMAVSAVNKYAIGVNVTKDGEVKWYRVLAGLAIFLWLSRLNTRHMARELRFVYHSSFLNLRRWQCEKWSGKSSRLSRMWLWPHSTLPGPYDQRRSVVSRSVF